MWRRWGFGEEGLSGRGERREVRVRRSGRGHDSDERGRVSERRTPGRRGRGRCDGVTLFLSDGVEEGDESGEEGGDLLSHEGEESLAACGGEEVRARAP